MSYLDQKRRAEQKAASRKADHDRLASGGVTAAQLNEANSLVPRHMMKNARIVRHGRRRITGEDIWDERDRQARALTDDELREAGLSNHEIVALGIVPENEALEIRLRARVILDQRAVQALLNPEDSK